MDKPEFVYVTYIASTPEAIWKAITQPEITGKYWYNVNVSESGWRPGTRWEHRDPAKDGPLRLVGKVVESDPPRRLVLTWAFPQDENDEAKQTRVTFDIEPFRGVVKLTVTHDRLEPDSDMLRGITHGWPIVLAGLKSMLETGKPLPKLW